MAGPRQEIEKGGGVTCKPEPGISSKKLGHLELQTFCKTIVATIKCCLDQYPKYLDRILIGTGLLPSQYQRTLGQRMNLCKSLKMLLLRTSEVSNFGSHTRALPSRSEEGF